MERTATVALALLLALLLAGRVTAETVSAQVYLTKCCGENEVLGGDGKTCVPAPWPPYAFPSSFAHERSKYLNDSAELRLWESWLQQWTPPGVHVEEVVQVLWFASLASVPRIAPIRGAAVQGPKGRVPQVDLHDDVALFDGLFVLRLMSDGHFVAEQYCVDVALPPFPAPFALRLPPLLCFVGSCVRECCSRKFFLKASHRGCLYYHKHNDVETLRCIHGARSARHLTGGERPPASVDGWFSTTTTCVDTDIYADMTLVDDGHHFVAQCNTPRVARFLYWLARPLSFAAILLLATALAAIAAKEHMRRSVHGWALASHAACLLAFDVTQAAYYLTVSDRVDASWVIPIDLKGSCLAFAFSAYFLLTAAACWLTAVCFNLSTGFKISPVLRSGGERRKYLLLSAFAWGTSLLMSLVYISIYMTHRHTSGTEGPLWYLPTLLETRTCFREVEIRGDLAGYTLTTTKWGSLVYYYGPMVSLCIFNVVCIVRTMRKVHFLRRGNSILKKEAEERRQGQKEREEMQTEGGEYQRQQPNTGPKSQQKSATIYVKLLLGAGAVELVAEAVAWASSWQSEGAYYMSSHTIYSAALDHSFPFRIVGYCADVLRAAIVLWMAAPDSGDLSALWRRLSQLWRCLPAIWRRVRPGLRRVRLMR